MSVAGALHQHLIDAATLAGTKVSPARSSQLDTLPRIVYERIGEERAHHFVDPDGFPRSTWQINCYGTTYAQAWNLSEEVRLALDGLNADDDTMGSGGYTAAVDVYMTARNDAITEMKLDGSDEYVPGFSLTFSIRERETVPTH